MGNLVRDPETKHTPQGKAVTEATIAVTEKWTTDSGEKREKTAFVGLVIWGSRGEAFAKYHKKGDKALIEGKLVQETWEDKEGKKREKTKVQVEQWHFLPRGDRSQSHQEAPRPTRPTQAPSSKIDPAPSLDGKPEEDDVPF
jgi:single-strand DNA-binding protein